MPIFMQYDGFMSINFAKVGGGMQLKLHTADVQGFTADESGEPTEEDIRAVAQAIDELYESMTPARKGLVHQLLEQAAAQGELTGG